MSRSWHIPAVDYVQVEMVIVVIIEKHGARTHSFDDVPMLGSAINVLEVDSGRFGNVNKNGKRIGNTVHGAG